MIIKPMYCRVRHLKILEAHNPTVLVLDRRPALLAGPIMIASDDTTVEFTIGLVFVQRIVTPAGFRQQATW